MSAVGLGYKLAFSVALIAESILPQAWLLKMKRRLQKGLLAHIETCSSPIRLETKGFEVDRRVDLTPDEFYREYFLTGRPVVFRGAAKTWKCCDKWTLDYFENVCGSDDLLLVEAQGLTGQKHKSSFEFLKVKELIQNIKAGGQKYLRFSPMVSDQSPLAKDLNIEWLDQMRGGKTFGRTYYMFIGGENRSTLLHCDQPCNLYVQVYGVKRWTLYLPEDAPLLYPIADKVAYVRSEVDFENPDRARFPLFRYARAAVVDLEPGDVLYVPPHVWHHVKNLSHTIAVGYRFSSLRAALKSSKTFSILRLLNMNPPIWKTIQYGKIDTNLIWAHTGGVIQELLNAKKKRDEMKPL